LKNIP